MERLNKIIISAIICLTSICSISCTQNEAKLVSKKGESSIKLDENLPCIDSILQERYKVKQNVCFSTDIEKHKKLIQENNEIEDWLYNMEEENLSAYTINNGEDTLLILISTPIGATGTTTSFYFWLIIDYNKKAIIKEVLSLSQNTRSWFIRNGQIHFVVFEFGEDFYIKERDYERLPITAIEYILNGDSLIETSLSNFICTGV